MILKRIATFITVLVFSITGAPSITLADVGDENAGSFDDQTAVEEGEEASEESTEVSSGSEAAGPGAGVWVAITGAVLALFSGGSSEYTTPGGNPPVVPPTPTPRPKRSLRLSFPSSSLL